MVSTEAVTFTTDATGAVTVLSRPVSGMVVEVRVPNAGTAWMPGGTADLTVTRLDDGGTVLAVSNATAPFVYAPVPAYHTTAGALAGTATRPGIPVDGHVQIVIAQGAASTAGTVYLHVQKG